MSSRRSNSYGNGGGHNRNSFRDNNQRQAQKPNHELRSKDSRAIQLLRCILNDEDDSSFSLRLANTNQLLRTLEESRNTVSDSLEFRQEQMQLLDICIHDEGLRRIIEFNKAPSSLKLTLAKIVSGLACYTRVDLALSWIFDRLLTWQTTDVNKDREWKKWLLRLLKQIFEDSATDQYTYKQTLEMAPTVLASTISFLDTMDTSEYLPMLIEILVYFSEHYQNLFGQRFKDIIDLLVGWSMDPDLSDSKRAKIMASYTKFGVYWASYLPFAINFLSHFLSDMQEIIQELTTLKDTEQYKKRWDACLNLLGCFQAIFDTILPLFSANSGYHQQMMIDSAFAKLLPEVLSLITNAQKLDTNTQWNESIRSILLYLIQYKPIPYRAYQYKIYQHLGEYSNHGSLADCQKYLETIIRFLNLWNSDIDQNIVYHLSSPSNSPLFDMHAKYRHNAKLDATILSLFRFLNRVPLSSQTRVQINHEMIVEFGKIQGLIKQEYDGHTASSNQRSLQQCMAFIKEHKSSSDQNDIETSSSTFTIEDALLFNFLLLDSATVWPELRFENTLESIEMVCIAWSTKSNHIFDSCVQLLTNYWVNVNFVLEVDEYLEMISCLLTDLLGRWPELGLQTRQTLCSFTESALTIVYEREDLDLDPTAIFKPIMSGFLSAAGIERDSNTKKLILKLVTYYCQIFGSADIVDVILEQVQKSINNPHQKIQRASKELLTSLNPFMISEVNRFDDHTTSFIQSIMMATPHTGSFRPVHYETVMKHLGMSEHLLGSDTKQSLPTNDSDTENSSEWARRLLHHCDTIGNMKNVSMFSELKEGDLGGIVDLINNSEPLLCYWAMWESARYCILSRLRTPFGGPQQTFAAFERMLQFLVSNADLEESNSEKVYYLRHLLLLLDRLELQISNASDGCATGSLPAVPRSSLIFFRTNKKTCRDYFLRIRPLIISGAKIVRNDHLLIAHATQLLRELESNIPSLTDIMNWFKTVNETLTDLIEACIREKYMDLIYGMQAWYKRLVRKVNQSLVDFKEKWSFEGYVGPLPKADLSSTTSVTWFQVAALFASGRDEMAVKSLNSLKSAVISDDFGILRMLDRQVVHFYTCLEDYDALQNLIDSGSTVIDDFICESLRSFNLGNVMVENQKQDVSSTQTFVKNAPLESCLELARLDKFRNWAARSSTEDISDALTERILQVLKDGIFTNISSLLELQLLQSDWVNLTASAKDWLHITSGNIPNFHHLPPETKHWARLSTYFQSLYTQNQGHHDPHVTRCLGYIQLHSAKVARRQNNIALADALIERAALIPDTQYMAMYERAKVLFLQSNYKQAMKTVNDVLIYTSSASGYEELKSKTYLKIARYLKTSPDEEVAGLLKTLDPNLIEMKATDLQSSVEVTIDFALKKSIENNTGDGRPWFEYATHHYKQGWRILDELLKSESSVCVVSWATEKIESLIENADPTVDKEQVQKMILGLLLKYSSSTGEKDLIYCESLTRELKQIAPFLDQASESLILQTLNDLHQMTVSKFNASAEAYFRYLSLDIHNDSAENSSTSMVITATLRLLRILTKYGEALQSLFSQQIEIVRVDLWKPVIPQLFAQLNHHSDFVRNTITKLISRICEEYPREIIYDVIVNSTSAKTNRDTKQNLNTIANRMMDQNNLLWVATRRMAEELEKITVLLEERWINKIASLQYDVMQQFAKLDQELERLSNSTDLSDAQQEESFLETYENSMKFVIASIETLLKSTQDASTFTPHEEWFRKTYEKYLINAFDLLQNPSSRKEYRRGWESFQKLLRQLMAETNKVRILELSQISPYLSNMRNTPIGIPGNHEKDDSSFIDSFGSNVIVLPTKTKPKKLDLRSTDGKKYSYLFKGLEDLHLDERIMQLITTTNGLLSENGATALRGMRARTYAVIPLSDHSGMIQWVNDATPFFALFKKWQKRESAAHMLLNNDKPNESVIQALNQRPTEQFTAKVASVLKASGLRVTANRRYWPKEILKKVYIELAKETPGDLLEKELYYSSSSATEWYKKSTSFSRSLAVTSMIGYIIGLGDRHLDNMLIDFRSGEVIHIDYNVCFEKGRRLRVPELVPYRLTQNLYGALGITGVDGQFKTAAEETLRVLRKHKEVLVTLLDAFIYDPLVDWESEAAETGYRQMMKLQANLSLVASRIIEKQAEQEKERKAILGSLSGLRHNLHQWQESMLLEAENSNDEDASEDEEQSNGSPTSPVDDEPSSFMGQLPVYLLHEVKSHLLGVISLISNSKSSTEGVSPLLESITMIETDTDNELRPAQKSAKMALDALSTMDFEIKELEKQLQEKISYESEWSYDQLLESIQIITKSVQDYYAALRTLEEFGPDSNKGSSTTNVNTEDNNKKPEEDHNQGTQEDRATVTIANQSSQGPFKQTSNNHATKIMKRIRQKLEGIDFEVKHKMSVTEQVARSIEQATSIDNLCMMYEGWTSWV